MRSLPFQLLSAPMMTPRPYQLLLAARIMLKILKPHPYPKLPTRQSWTLLFSEFEGVGMIRVQVPDDNYERHLPANSVCVLGKSYSMNNAATTQDDQEGSSGLSPLDVVKHDTKTVIASLGPEGKLAIVTYSDKAMTTANNGMATQVEAFKPRGATNIWAGLFEAMDLGAEGDSATDIFLYTNGRPVIHLPRRELETQ
eukprot:scaffold22668_cov161-Cylindrotheca_fusiformis.AAC.2